MDKTKVVILVVIAALLIFAVVQIVEVSSLKSDLKQVGYGDTIPVASGGPAPANTQNAYPAMVGGC